MPFSSPSLDDPGEWFCPNGSLTVLIASLAQHCNVNLDSDYGSHGAPTGFLKHTHQGFPIQSK
jgi:hypothetical protein